MCVCLTYLLQNKFRSYDEDEEDVAMLPQRFSECDILAAHVMYRARSCLTALLILSTKENLCNFESANVPTLLEDELLGTTMPCFAAS